jgi:hypothetical protein
VVRTARAKCGRVRHRCLDVLRLAAMARVLLSDATSPVYSRRGHVDLSHAVAAAAAQLDPALPLLPPEQR